MTQALKPKPPRTTRLGTLVLLGLVGASAAAWLQSKRGEAALHDRTAGRLRALSIQAPA